MLYPLSYWGGAGAKGGRKPVVSVAPALTPDSRGRFASFRRLHSTAATHSHSITSTPPTGPHPDGRPTP